MVEFSAENERFKRGREKVNRLVKKIAKFNVSEGARELGDVCVKVEGKSEVGERGREFRNLISCDKSGRGRVSVISVESEMSESGREVGNVLFKRFAESKMGKGRREIVYFLVKRGAKS